KSDIASSCRNSVLPCCPPNDSRMADRAARRWRHASARGLVASHLTGFMRTENGGDVKSSASQAEQSAALRSRQGMRGHTPVPIDVDAGDCNHPAECRVSDLWRPVRGTGGTKGEGVTFA